MNIFSKFIYLVTKIEEKYSMKKLNYISVNFESYFWLIDNHGHRRR